MTKATNQILLAAELGAAVAEFNHLANLASEMGLIVQAEIQDQPTIDQPAPRPILAINIVQPLTR